MRGRVSLTLRGLLVVALGGAVLPAVVANSASGAGVKCPSGLPDKLAFSAPSYIDQDRAGGEPVSQVAQDGSIVVSAHAGTTHVYKDPNAVPGSADFVAGYFNQTLNWRSADGGKTWTYVGLYGNPEGPHTLTTSGFSDPDLTMDAGGKIYNTEIDLANDSVFYSPDNGQTFPYGNPMAGNGDRPWLTGADPDVVYLYINSTPLHQLLKSTDGGITFSTVTQDFPAEGKLIVDPLNPHHGLIGPSGSGATISPDDGVHWTTYPGSLGSSTQFFGAVAVDRKGNIYAAAAGGYTGSGDTTPNGQVTFNYFDRGTKTWLAQPIVIKTPPGDALWPWIMAGDDGRVAVVWYQSLAGSPDKFYIYAAETIDGHGTTVKCSDGSKKKIPPVFRVANASGRSIHDGAICLDGTLCNADTDFQNGDRRLGDFFTVNYMLDGTIFIVSGDTMLTSLTGSPKPVANPIFMKQMGGTPLLKKPIPAQPPKPPCGFPCLPT